MPKKGKSYAGGNKGNKSVTGKYPHSISKGKSMVGSGGSAGSGRRSGGKRQRTMLTG